jgi:hypothetical protein
MGHTYERKYPEAPTAEEIKTGYAPSTISGTPFAKFLFWTFAGLAVTYAVTLGVIKGLDAMETAEQSRYERMAARRPVEFQGPPLQPSPGHPTIDWEDMAIKYKADNTELVSKGWTAQPGKMWLTSMSEAGVKRTAEAIAKQRQQTPGGPPATKPADAHHSHGT